MDLSVFMIRGSCLILNSFQGYRGEQITVAFPTNHTMPSLPNLTMKALLTMDITVQGRNSALNKFIISTGCTPCLSGRKIIF